MRANAGDLDGTTVYLYNRQQVIETRDGSNNVVHQFIHGTQYIDELVMVRVKDKGDLYVYQGERSERERVATGQASTKRASDLRARPQRVSTRRTNGGANWNVIGLTDLGGHLVERYVYTPYGELTVDQVTGYGDRDGDGDVDSTDKGTPGTDCTGTVTGSCRILDLDFDGDYDSADAALFDALPQGNARHPGRTSTNVDQPCAHQALLFDAEIASYQNRARQYDPGKRRFAQRDPLAIKASAASGYQDGLNLYYYMRGNPLVLFDPSGLSPPCDDDCFQNFQEIASQCDPGPFFDLCFDAARDSLANCVTGGSGSPPAGPGCGSAPSAPPGPVCGAYGACDRYLGSRLQCFCNCTSSSPWNDRVRGCLACHHSSGCTETGQAHEICYAVADAEGLSGQSDMELLACWAQCL